MKTKADRTKNSEDLKAFFHSKKLKCTPQRLAVLKALRESGAYMSINQLDRKVKEMLPGTGLATVYRALETLEELGLIVKVHLEDGCHSYAVAPEGHMHPVVCTECNRVIEFAECPLGELSEKLTQDTGIQIENHFLQLFGKCRECRA
ncbi:MAG TPA: transcriptional repressor [Thermodesulfobacteriota bacterium]|nr:transcriptional repressor [Thermodesulfobacteriota bacterium]